MTLKVLLTLLLLPCCSYCAAPEMWVVCLDKEVPSITPGGRQNDSIGFVLRVCSSGKDEQFINLYGAVGAHLLDSSGKRIPWKRVDGGSSLAPNVRDILQLKPGVVGQKCYTMDYRGGVFTFADGSGHVYAFDKVGKGRFQIEVVYDFGEQGKGAQVAEFEEKYIGLEDARKKVFRGPLVCGKFWINVEGKSTK